MLHDSMYSDRMCAQVTSDPGLETTELADQGVSCVPEHFILAEILVLVGAILPAPEAPAITGIFARLKRVQRHVCVQP